MRNYSTASGGTTRPILTNTPERFTAFAERERIRDWLSKARQHRNSNSDDGATPNDLTALIMGMDANKDIPYVLAMMIELESAGLSITSEEVPSFVRNILINGMNVAHKTSTNAETVKKIKLAGIIAYVLYRDWDEDNWQQRINDGREYVKTLKETVRTNRK